MIERIRQWTDESDRAVSPVIGVILMVAITVILAAVIGSFVLGIGGDLNETPQVRFAASDATGGAVAQVDNSTPSPDELFTIEHQGGDTIDAADMRLEVTDTDGNDIDVSGSIDSFGVGDTQTFTESAEDEVTSSQDIRIRIVHTPSESLLLDTTITIE